jgi:hypothetical protein
MANETTGTANRFSEEQQAADRRTLPTGRDWDRKEGRSTEEQAAMDKRAAGDLNPEEQAAVDQAKRDLELIKSRVGQTPMLLDPLWLLTEEGKKVLAVGLGRDHRGEPREFSDERVTVVIPKPFTFTLTHHHKFDIQQGIREIPRVLAEHPWFVNNGVTTYRAGAAPPAPAVLLGSQTMSDPVNVGGRMMPLGPFVVAAHTTSKLTVEEWNVKTDAERDAMIQAEVERVAAAGRPDPAATGGGKKGK